MVLPSVLRARLRPLSRPYSTNQPTVREIADFKSRLSQYGAGTVTLDKTTEASEGLAVLTLSNPGLKNALSGSMMAQFNEVSKDLEAWANEHQNEARGLILRSDLACPGLFCSGGDLNTVKAIGNPKDGNLMCALMHETLKRIRALPLVSACAVHGRALGGGAELTLLSDFRLLTPTAQLVFVQSRMGVITGWGGGSRLCDLVGPKKALEILMTCQKIGAKEATDLGLCDHILEESETDPLPQVKDWLLTFLGDKDPSVVRAISNMSKSSGNFHERLDQEREQFYPLWGGHANQKALSANIKHK